jgi:hypothetical protein
MSLEEAYGNDADKELHGVWIRFKGGVQLLMRRAGGLNVGFQRVLAKRLAALRKEDGEEPTDKEATEAVATAYAEAIVLDWRTRTVVDGKEQFVGTVKFRGQDVPFSREACIDVLTTMPDFFLEVRQNAAERAQFTAAAKERDSKN